MEELSLETTGYSLRSEPPRSANRRSAQRHLTLFRVGALSVDGRRELCLIKNISAGGMSIRPYCELAAGTPVVIELKSGVPVRGTVAWSEETGTGVEFDQPIDVLDILMASNDGPKPRMPRVEIDCPASVRAGATVYRLRACDVSQGGVKLVGELPDEVATDVTVTLPGLAPQLASLRWNSGGHCGLTFNRLLALSELVDWLRTIRH